MLECHAYTTVALNAECLITSGQSRDQRVFRIVLEIAPAKRISVNVHSRSQPLCNAVVLHLLADILTHQVCQICVPGLRNHRSDRISCGVLIPVLSLKVLVTLRDSQAGRSVCIRHGRDFLASDVQTNRLSCLSIDIFLVRVVHNVLSGIRSVRGSPAGGLSCRIRRLGTALDDICHLRDGQPGYELLKGDVSFLNIQQGCVGIIRQLLRFLVCLVSILVIIDRFDVVFLAERIVIPLLPDSVHLRCRRDVCLYVTGIRVNPRIFIRIDSLNIRSRKRQLDRSGGIATIQRGSVLVCLVKLTLQFVVFLNILFLCLIIEFP